MNKFKAPKNIEQLVASLSDKDENTFIVAGGTDLTIKINESMKTNFNLIDISNTKGMMDIEEIKGEIHIGAAVTMTEISENKIIHKRIPSLKDAAESIGSTQVRNRATIGGNVSNAAQCADTLPVLFAHNAICEIINSKGEIRREFVEKMILNIGKTSLKKDEAIIKIIIPCPKGISCFTKIGDRKAVTISKINSCIILCINEKIIEDAIIYLGSVGVMPIKATLIENEIKGKILNEGLIFKIRDSIKLQIEEAIPNRPSKHYKKEAIVGLIEDGILKLIERSIAFYGI